VPSADPRDGRVFGMVRSIPDGRSRRYFHVCYRFFIPNYPLLIIYQVDLPTLGRDCYHIVNLLINVYIYRSEGQLPPRKYPRLEVRLLCFIYCIIPSRPRTLTQLLLFVRSYLVLTAGFYFAPYRPGSDTDESVKNVLGPMVIVRTLSESWRLFWSVP
jgi:hypothetical protein